MEKYRIDNLLAKLAENGIKIFIIVWKEVEIAGMYNDSAHSKKIIMEKSNK